MGFTKRYIEKTAAKRIPTPLLDAAGKALIEGVNKAVVSRWGQAIEVAAAAPGRTPQEKTQAIAAPIKKNLAALGAAAGATAAAPGVGTSVAVGTLAAELGVVALKTADLVMAIGAAHGFHDADADERRAWVLAVLAFGDDAAEEFATLARDMGLRVTDGHELDIAHEAILGGGGGQLVTVDALRRINTVLVAQILKKWGTRRGAATLGKLLPFGIGAVVGSTANFIMIREFASQSERFFANYDREFILGHAHPTDEDRSRAIDVSGRQEDS